MNVILRVLYVFFVPLVVKFDHKDTKISQMAQRSTKVIIAVW